MRGQTAESLLAFARDLLRATDFTDLLTIAHTEIKASLGYQHVWLMVADREDAQELRLIEFSGDKRAAAWEVAPVLKVAGDKFLEEIVSSEGPVVVEDARVDPRTNKQIVQQLQNRTIVNIPLRLLDKPFGVLGLGTFGDEGCRVPTPDELDYIVMIAGHLVVAAGRIRFIEARERAEKERLALERRLLQVQKLESLGMLAGGVAHDFNNLLTVILSSVSFAETATDDPRVIEEIRTINEAAERARDLTRKLLALSRQQELDLRPLDINFRLSELIALLQRVLPETITLDFIRASTLPLCEGDASQLDQVFMNLCINARDAMPNGGRLTLETEQVLINGSYAKTHPWAKPGRYVLTTITDTGVGIDSDILDRIFDPFFTTKAEAGSGLGLSIAYGIVRQHNGMLQCYSEPGVGSSFKVYLPALERLASSVGTKLAGGVPRGDGKEKLLVAEDDSGVRSVAVRILERAGYRVTAVENGDLALDAAHRERFDLFILDVVMPGTPCRQVVDKLRTTQPGARILLASGYTAGTNLFEWLNEAQIELLRKPYDPDQLLFAVRRALDWKPLAAPPRR
jgi:signal transduction histidine kinase/ActR/RegA family two-component response regulator